MKELAEFEKFEASEQKGKQELRGQFKDFQTSC